MVDIMCISNKMLLVRWYSKGVVDSSWFVIRDCFL